jgi:Flp pilus assembly protein TadD
LLPILIISVRWPSYFGDPSRLGVAITTFILQIAHAALFLFCIWIALGSPLSPKHKLGLPSLTLYYLGALSIGYFAGYFLLVFGASGERSRRTPGYVRLINGAVQAAVWLLLLLVPALLIARNLPQIRQGRPFMEQFAGAMAEKIPKTKTVLLSDNPRQLYILRAYLTRQGSESDYVFVDTTGLEKSDYHRFLLKRYGNRWPVDLRTQDFDSTSLIGIVERLATSNQIYYLHPSFGAFFEAYYPEPHGLVYKLNSFPTNTLLAPAMPESVRVENEKFWATLNEQSLESLAEITSPSGQRREPPLVKAINTRAHLVTDPNPEATLFGPFYAHALVAWGDELQKMVSWGEQLEKRDLLTNAAAAFELAVRLDPENVVAPINLDCNKALQKGIKIPPADPKTLEDKFGKYRRWADLLNADGPFDDPSFCYQQGRVFAAGRLLRQAAHQFYRTKSLAPQNLLARLWLAQIYLLGKMPDETLRITQECHAQAELLGLNKTNRAELLSLETSALLAKQDVKAAVDGVQAALKDYPGSEELLGTAARIFINHQQYTNALKFIDQQLLLSPDLPPALRAKGFVYLQIGEQADNESKKAAKEKKEAVAEEKQKEAREAYEKAIEPLTRALATETNVTAHSPDYYTSMLNRAIAYLRADRLDEAKRDYEALQKVAPRMYQIFYGLAEIARKKNDKATAIRNYQSYLASQPESAEEIKTVQDQLKELKAGSP